MLTEIKYGPLQRDIYIMYLLKPLSNGGFKFDI